ncbi:NAD(P)-binding protein [Xylariaceae sp. FL1019]|nr:NAD(P)-binding protein [Xylariaceae sp. FL1019]
MATKLTLDGGFALVTGAASGIGKESAFAFAAAGVQGVLFADIDVEGAKKAAEESKQYATSAKYRAEFVDVDVTSEESVKKMVALAKEKFGRIDYNVNSAGIGNPSLARTKHIKADVFRQTLETNVTGTMLCVKAVTGVMAEQEPRSYKGRHGDRSLGRGSIVNLGSLNSYVAFPGTLSYTTAKHAVMGITRSAAMDCLSDQIRVNAVCPFYVDTPMMQKSIERVPPLGDMIKKVSPLERAATVDEVADYIVFLCSPSATYINGTGLAIDAGVTLTAQTV